MDDLYQEFILDHSRYPHNKVSLKMEPRACVMQNFGCGDELRVLAEWNDRDEVLSVVWDGAGCAISQATASILSSRVVGLSRSELVCWNVKQVEEILGIELSAARQKCALLFLRALLQNSSVATSPQGELFRNSSS